MFLHPVTIMACLHFSYTYIITPWFVKAQSHKEAVRKHTPADKEAVFFPLVLLHFELEGISGGTDSFITLGFLAALSTQYC